METNERMVVPGDEIAAAEEFVCGDGTYERDGKIYAAVAGKVVFDQKEKVAEVRAFNPPVEIRRGDIVVGTVKAVRSAMVEIEVCVVEGKDRPITGETTASVHVSKMSNRYVEDTRDAYRLGDYVRAKVIQVDPSVQLITDADEFGVIKALCTQCRSPMEMTEKGLYCGNCERGEKRKIAKNYSAAI